MEKDMPTGDIKMGPADDLQDAVMDPELEVSGAQESQGERGFQLSAEEDDDEAAAQ